MKKKKPTSNNKNDKNEKTDEISNIKEKNDQLENLPEEIQEFVKDAPPAVRRSFTAMLQTRSSQFIGHPLFEKFTPEHIDNFLDYSYKDDENTFRLTSSNRWFYLIYTILFVAFLVFLIIYLLPSNQEMLSEILKILISLAGGFGIGYGWKSYRETKK
ncbi:MAG: hypothetical protein SCK70_08405 [bacterium]|nr:hypothetical protein [bacterium]